MLSIIERPQLVVASQEPRALSSRGPFALTLDQRFLYPSDSYLSVVQDVRRALQYREGLVVVTGEAGTGKTMLCRTLVDQLEPSACASIVLDPYLSLEELLVHILTDFGVVTASWNGHLRPLTSARHQLIALLQQFLNSLIPLNAYVVIVIDEAQHLQPAVLEQLRVLLNFETETGKLLQVVLVGQPDLTAVLQRPELRRLDERVARRCELRPLLPDEVTGYIERRLLIAQRLTRVGDTPQTDADPSCAFVRTPVTFTASAVDAVARLSHGVPRRVNMLCEFAMEIGAARRVSVIDARAVRAGAARLSPASDRRTQRIRVTTVAAAVTLLVAAGSVVWTWADDRPMTVARPELSETIRGAAPQLAREVRPLEVVEGVSVAVASYRSEAQASAIAAGLEARGLPAFVRGGEATGWHQIVVGPYVAEEEARAAQTQLLQQGYSSANVFVEAAQSAVRE